MNCDACYRGRHIRCTGCSCTVCAARARGQWSAPPVTPRPPRAPKAPRLPKARVHAPPKGRAPTQGFQPGHPGWGGRPSKLTPAEMAEVRQQLAEGVSCAELGRRFDVHHTTIMRIRDVTYAAERKAA